MKTVRKYICIMMSALIVLMLPAAVSAFAAETSSKDFVVENGILVDYKGENNLLEVVSIPSNLGITAIGENAFSDTVIRTVIIPKGVTTIKKYAFADCASLKSVSLPDTLTTIEDYSFSGCDNLTEIYLPDSVKNFGECIFEKKDQTADFIIWSRGTSAAAEYAARYMYNYVNFDDISEFGFYAYDQERRIPVYTHTSEGYFEKAGYTLLENGELINSLPPYLTWSCDNEALATACAGTVIWHGEGYAKIRATDPLSGTYIEFELSVYYVDTEILESETAKKANLEPGMTVAYRFTPYISGKYQINASPSDGAIFFIITDSKGLAMASGYDGVPAFFEAGKTYIIEAFNFGVDTSKTEYTFILKEETFNCNVSAGNGGAVRGGGIYSNGDLVMLQAIPADGYMFEGWYENGKKIPGATANFVLAIRTDRTLTAKFVPYEFEINRITIEGICSKGQRLTFVPEIVGGAGKHKYAFYIYKEGKMYYINKNSTGKTFSYTPTSAGTYTVMVYSIDETGNKVSFTEQFTII